jgi:hypothetical protein
MKKIKNRLLQNTYEAEPAEQREQSQYIRRIAYWVGLFIIEFNELESVITRILSSRIHRMDFSGYEYVFLTGMMFNNKVELLARLYKYETNFVNPDSRKEEMNKRAAELINELKALGSRRNTIAHANYFSLDENGNIRENIKFSESDAEEAWVAISRDFIVENINIIYDLTEKLEEFDDEARI